MPNQRLLLPTLTLFAVALISGAARGQGDPGVEEKFIAMLKNATLEGSWAPIRGGAMGAEVGDDHYQIARVEKKDNGKWSVVSVFEFGGRTMEFPLEVDVRFAGDCAVMMLNDVRAGMGAATWTARVMYFDDTYAGRWWESGNKEHGGTISGIITRKDEETTATAADAEPAADASSKLYEVRMYTAADGKLPQLSEEIKDDALPLFKKHGVEPVFFGTVSEGVRGEDADDMLVAILAYPNDAARDAAWAALTSDPAWNELNLSEGGDNRLLAKEPRSITMTQTDFSDSLAAAKPGDAPRLFELRQYNDGPDRVPSTVDRFASGEKDLFVKHGMQTLAFWTANDDSAFIYLLAHKDRPTSRESWTGFFGDFQQYMAQWQASQQQAQPQAQPQRRGAGVPGGGRGQQRGGGSEVRFLVPTDYSPLK